MVYHVRFYLVYVYLGILAHQQLNLALLFLLDLNQIAVHNNTQTLDDLISFMRKAIKYLFKDIRNLISLHFIKFLVHPTIVKLNNIKKPISTIDLHQANKKLVFNSMRKQINNFMRPNLQLNNQINTSNFYGGMQLKYCVQ